jgi:hypothetical protein
MQVYVAGSLADAEMVRVVQAAVRSSGHDVILDWTRGPDASLIDYAADPRAAGTIARVDLAAVLQAEAVLVVVGRSPGLGMFVELGAALACAERGEPKRIAVLGPETTDSVFYFHPAVQRCATVEQWLASL